MANTDTHTLLRSIPAVEELLNAPWAVEFSAGMGREYVKKAIVQALDGIRGEIGGGAHAKTELGALAAGRAAALLRQKSSSTLKRVINATGVVIHTNTGRAPLAREALQAVSDIASTYSTLEYSPEKGGREGRNTHIEWLICHITGAQAAIVVNNNAAAVLLALAATASGREVIVSNGELVEIGDSFRIPEILSFSGATMVAVGCTNSTRIADYRNAITEKTAVLLKVHPSNYRIEGFVASTSREELKELAASHGLAFIEDLGSGLLCPLGVPFAHFEHSVRDCLEAGAGAVTFSGDKLLGGPQIGVIAGSKQLVDAMRSHQLLRALRVDKMTLAAFEATLRMYASGKQGEIPVIRMIEADKDTLQKKAQQLCRTLKERAKTAGADDVTIAVVQTADATGGGAFPTNTFEGAGVSIHSAARSAESIAAAFRTGPVPVIAGVRDGRVVLHVRTLLDGDEKTIACAFAGILGGAG
ncbi:MAG: L-seryl-tRNA(Sec) selenium transferase [Treponema sp.]|nr:L-seryl-tRNA(Sec) selenium transferase [Treponema sp.]